MQKLEVVGKTKEEALARAAEKLGVEATDLEVLEEYEPDELDLKSYAEELSLAAPPSIEEATLYQVQISFEHYLREAQEWTQGLIERFAPGAKAEAIRFRNIIIVRLDVPEASILIGKQGATLDALQHVVVRALLTIDENFPDVMLDVERYREKKLIRLEKEARQAADKALRTGRRVPLTPMSPPERKFIHNILKDFAGVRSESRGEDRRRHIVVEAVNPPARQSGGPRFEKGPRQDGRGKGKGGPRGAQQNGGNRKDKVGDPISEEQRQLLYGKAMAANDDDDFEDEELEEKRSLLPEFQDNENPDDNDEDDGQMRFMDEIDQNLR